MQCLLSRKLGGFSVRADARCNPVILYVAEVGPNFSFYGILVTKRSTISDTQNYIFRCCFGNLYSFSKKCVLDVPTTRYASYVCWQHVWFLYSNCGRMSLKSTTARQLMLSRVNCDNFSSSFDGDVDSWCRTLFTSGTGSDILESMKIRDAFAFA